MILYHMSRTRLASLEAPCCMQYVAWCSSVLQCVALCCSVLQSVLQCVAECVAVCCGVLQWSALLRQGNVTHIRARAVEWVTLHLVEWVTLHLQWGSWTWYCAMCHAIAHSNVSGAEFFLTVECVMLHRWRCQAESRYTRFEPWRIQIESCCTCNGPCRRCLECRRTYLTSCRTYGSTRCTYLKSCRTYQQVKQWDMWQGGGGLKCCGAGAQWGSWCPASCSC